MGREIGSYFWLSEDDLNRKRDKTITPEIFGCHGSDFTWVSLCRSAITLIIETIEQRNPHTAKRVCLPGFTCNTVFEPFLKAGYEVEFLPVDINLNINANELLDHILFSNPGIVLLHRYFGFDTLPNINHAISQIRDKGIVVIEDITQSMYSNISRLDADYFVGSIRKWCGVPDGGFAVCANRNLKYKPSCSDLTLEKQKIIASLLKWRYVEFGIGEKSSFLKEFKEAEHTISTQMGIYDISPVSYQIQTNLNIGDIKSKRRDNYKSLLEMIEKSDKIAPIFKSLDGRVTPLYFPIYCKNRNELQCRLISNNIYAPVVWPKDSKYKSVGAVTDNIYDRILCIPIDQRYDYRDMERVASIINQR